MEDAKIKDWIDCDVSAGMFRWRKTSGKGIAGAVGGAQGLNGYIYLGVRGRRFLAHRLVWWFAHGAWPESAVDHINGNKTDNRLENLRVVSSAGNAQNQRRATSANKLGVLGVNKTRGGRYVAHICCEGKRSNLGVFETAELAHAAYLNAKRKTHATCTI